MYSTSLAMIAARSWVGGSPAACTSLIRGRVILPSGRTGTVRLTVVLFHTAMSSTSSMPILYSGPTGTPPAGACAPGGAGAGAAAVGVDPEGGRFISCAAANPAIISETTTEATMGLYRFIVF